MSPIKYVFASVLMFAAAQASEPYPEIVRQVAVSRAGLDLNKLADARVFLDRIASAARQACGVMAERDPAYPMSPEFVSRNFKACLARATAETVASLRVPAVSQAYAESREESRTREARR